jgi:hypothetical protein
MGNEQLCSTLGSYSVPTRFLAPMAVSKIEPQALGSSALLLMRVIAVSVPLPHALYLCSQRIEVQLLTKIVRMGKLAAKHECRRIFSIVKNAAGDFSARKKTNHSSFLSTYKTFQEEVSTNQPSP